MNPTNPTDKYYSIVGLSPNGKPVEVTVAAKDSREANELFRTIYDSSVRIIFLKPVREIVKH